MKKGIPSFNGKFAYFSHIMRTPSTTTTPTTNERKFV